MKKSIILFFLSIFVVASSVYSQKLDNLLELKRNSHNSLFHNLGKASKVPAFQMEGYWVWGSSVVKSPDGKYHMYVSRFPKSLPFHP